MPQEALVARAERPVVVARGRGAKHARAEEPEQRKDDHDEHQRPADALHHPLPPLGIDPLVDLEVPPPVSRACFP
jgi:hypothetical protein